MKIAIIGAGVAGLSCARRLAAAGQSVVVHDKGRGIGGRCATRRAGEGQRFDHGAPVLSGTGAGFLSLLAEARAADAVADWQAGAWGVQPVGRPGMTGFARFLGQGIDIRQQAEVTGITATGEGWVLQGVEPLGPFDRVICTAPAPQTARLAPDQFADATSAASYHPCLTLMVALNRPLGAPVTQANPTDALAWIARDSAKPGRLSQSCWVAQASTAWSIAHLDLTKDEIAARMLDLFLTHHGLDATDVAYASAHRWRYALVARPLGQPFVTSTDGTLYAGGDWCLGPKVEHAWQSGTAIADDILSRA